ncbi:hypothetical protein BN2497_173 [Janthinobacterium sp. CG23_2]|nr:hypothetical protein BN2497_173 [Janthinobacterium sp. CG23_2]CUU26484.1 hypothetical protein BN3177_173 [Janthinobacterium sp. CG23_2]
MGNPTLRRCKKTLETLASRKFPSFQTIFFAYYTIDFYSSSAYIASLTLGDRR